ncbi:MAG: hypothetical protein Q7T03_10020 [Deltaproteobacteria bacterium]|nr:hypothetical protein [Deltaproteobacteria bacterium]
MDCAHLNWTGKMIATLLGICEDPRDKEEQTLYIPPSARGARHAMRLIDNPDGWEAKQDLDKINAGRK